MPISQKHILNVASPLDYKSMEMWFRYGVNKKTKFPELVVLRGIYLRQLAEQIKAKYFAEVGTARGWQSFMWAQYLIEAGHEDGLVYTCDTDRMDHLIYKTFFSEHIIFTRRQLWKNTPQSKFVKFTQGTSAELKLSIKNKIDILFIDGQHSEKAVLDDFANLYTFLHSGSIVVFDDCDERYPGIENAVKRIHSSFIDVDVEIIGFTPHQYKIAVMRLKNEPS